ncbi:hypothetical protein ACFLW6_03375 [Chloroflexota bacterium]
MKRPDLLLLVAIWQFLNAFLCLIGIAAIAIFAFPGALGHYGAVNVGSDIGALFGLSTAILFLLCCIGLSIAGGIGLLLGKAWGRIISIINAVLSLLSIPIGTVIGVLVLIYLTRSEIRDYFEGSH